MGGEPPDNNHQNHIDQPLTDHNNISGQRENPGADVFYQVWLLPLLLFLAKKNSGDAFHSVIGQVDVAKIRLDPCPVSQPF